MNKKTLGSIITVVGVMLCLASLGLVGYNLIEDRRAGSAVESVLEQITLPVSEKADVPDTQTEDTPYDDAPDPYREMPVVEIDGYGYIGVLEIPSLELRLPVMDRWDYTRMKTAPCRYSGSVYSNDLIIAAHNYSSHFGTLTDLVPDDEIIFTDMDGNAFRYIASQLETLDGTAVEEMQSGEWDLTLFTCTISGRARTTVRCISSDNE